ELSQGFDARAVLAESVLDHTEIEARDDDGMPAVSDSTQGNIEHGDDLVAERFVAVEGYCAEEFLAFGIPGIVRSGVGLLLGQVDLLADAPGDLFGMAGEEVDQRFFLKASGQILG